MVFTVGIAGITGKFARLVATRLLSRPDVAIRGYCRNPAKLPASLTSSQRVQIFQGEATDQAALRTFASGSDVVVCCYLGDDTLMIQGQKRLIDACEAEGVERYVASDYTIDFTKLEHGQLPSKDAMKVVKEYLDAKMKTQGVHVLIGTFMDTFWNPWFQIWRPDEMTLRYWGSGEETWESTPYANAADFVAEVAMDRKATGMQKFLGDKKSIREIADTFSVVYNKMPRLECLGSMDDLYQTMQAKREEDERNTSAYMPLQVLLSRIFLDND